jgi:uncharacterized protein (TIGR02231 family)
MADFQTQDESAPKSSVFPPLRERIVESTITAVTVYTNQAVIKRSAQISLTGSEQELVLAHLPLALQPDSVRVSGRGTVAVQLRGVRTDRVYAIEPIMEKVAQVTASIEHIEQQLRSLQDSHAALRLQQTFVQNFSEQSVDRIARSLARQKMGLPEIGEVITFLGQRHGRLAKAIASQEQQKTQLEKQLQALRQQLKQIQTPQPKESYTLYVGVEVATAGDFDLEVEYACADACWNPLYDVTVHQAENRLSLTYLAEIQQLTGEDWLGCALTLSTAKPGLGMLPPKPDPWYIDIPRISPPVAAPMAMRRMRRKAEDADESYADAVAAGMMLAEAVPAPERVEANAIASEISHEGGVVTFSVGGNNHIPGDGAFHKVTVFKEDYPCRLEYIAMPKAVSFAYLQAIAVNPTEGATLLPGSANIFRENRFVGTVDFENISPGQAFKIHLGIDEGLKIERDLVERDVDKRFLGGQRRTTYAYRLTITNLLAQRTTLRLTEQIPVSRHEQIKVRLTQSNPTTPVDKMGTLEWDLTLHPQAKQELYYQFVVESPPDFRITGLEI